MTQTTLTLPTGYTTRPATLDDAAIVSDLINTCSQAALGENSLTAEEKRNAWQTPGLDITSDTRLVFAPDGTPAGHMEFWDVLDPHIQATLHLHVHPGHNGQGIGAYLLDVAHTRAQDMIAIAPEDAQVVILTSLVGSDQAGETRLVAHDYAVTRYFWRMLIEIDAAPPEPIWPDGITVRTHVRGQDDQAMHALVEDTFADHWRHVPIAFEQWKHWNLDDDEFDPSLWFLAVEGEAIIGGLMSWPTFNDDLSTALISDLGVRRAWRRQGLGQALLLHTFGEYYRRGTRKVALIVDADSPTGADRLYERVGMLPVKRRVVFEKVLREGASLTIT